MDLAQIRKKALQAKKEESRTVPATSPAEPPKTEAWGWEMTQEPELDSIFVADAVESADAMPAPDSPAGDSGEDLGIVLPPPEEPASSVDAREVFVASAPVVTPYPEKTARDNGFNPVALILAGREAAEAEEESSFAADAEESQNVREFLCLRVAREEYAIDIMDIKEIIKPREVTEVPRSPTFVPGIISLRGMILPVFDIGLRLGFQQEVCSGKERIVVVRRGEGFCGILVDEVSQVIRLPEEALEPPPPVLEGIDRDFVTGIGRHGDRMLILLNLEKVLDINVR